MLEGLADDAPGPEAQYETREAISLAFVTALQLLPPNQRAVLLLRDVLGYRASESAELLGMTEDAVTSALKRARAAMAGGRTLDDAPPRSGGPEEREVVDRFVAAFTSGDVDAVIALFTDDIWVRMPPLPFEYHGPEAAHRFLTAVGPHRATLARMVPVRANRQPAWGEYVRDPATGGLHLVGVLVAVLSGNRIRELAHFETTVAPWFGLPRTLDI
jgi:RNA polymerase sigma-70 factor (ECF subfamily)